MNWTPEKYWNVGDERIPLLKEFLASTELSAEVLLPTDEIIKACIKAVPRFPLSEKNRETLKNLILAQNGKILQPCIKTICDQISFVNSSEITLISLGCGDESLFEQLLDEEIAKRFPSLGVHWLGLDVGDFRGPESFFNTQPFKIIDSGFVQYRLLAKTDMPTLLVGRYAYHHLGIELHEFKERCSGLTSVLLIEEPATSELWEKPDYRIMRIAYDVLGNTVFIIEWASEFLKDSKKFKVNYLKSDMLPPEAKLLEFPDVLPETALISL